MRRILFLSGVVLLAGCQGGSEPQVSTDDPSVQEAMNAFMAATAVAESRDPRVRLDAWQRKLVNENEYVTKGNGSLQLGHAEFIVNWQFGQRDVVLTVAPKPKLDSEERELIFTIVSELGLEWRMGQRFIYEEDRQAGNRAVSSLEEAVVRTAIEIESNSDGLPYPDAFPTDKLERIRMLSGTNHALAQSLAFKTLQGTGKELRGDSINGDVFRFSAQVEFSRNGDVRASLSITGK